MAARPRRVLGASTCPEREVFIEAAALLVSRLAKAEHVIPGDRGTGP